MTVVVVACLGVLSLAAGLCLLRAVRAESLADRAIALDTVTAIIISGIAVGVVWNGDGLFVDLALVLGLLGFLATTSVARYVGRRGQ